MNGNWEKFIDISVKVAIIFFAIRCVFSINEITSFLNGKKYIEVLYNAFGFMGEAVFATTIVMTLFNKCFWKCKMINFVIDSAPVLEKEYEGYITYVDNFNKIHKKKALMNIDQTFLDCFVKFKTDESVSNSLHVSIENIMNEKQLIYLYINEPKTELREKSQIHYGTVILKIEKDKLSGEYFTSRQTKGSIEMKPRIKR